LAEGAAGAYAKRKISFRFKKEERLKLTDLCFGAISAPSDSFGDGLLAAFEHIPHLLDGKPARGPKLASSATRGVGNPISSVFARLGSQQKRQSDSDSKTDQQTQYGASLCHDIPFHMKFSEIRRGVPLPTPQGFLAD
jgi:hypothetical protein